MLLLERSESRMNSKIKQTEARADKIEKARLLYKDRMQTLEKIEQMKYQALLEKQIKALKEKEKQRILTEARLRS